MNSQVYIPAPTQRDYQHLLQRMHQKNYGQFRPEELMKMLYAYFYFLEREITGEEETWHANASFSISELESIIVELELLLEERNEQKQRAVELITQLNAEPPHPKIDIAVVTAVVGDITQQPDCDAIVNAANPQLRRGGGVCGAIHRAAGAELEINAIKLGPIQVGEAVITHAYDLPNQWVVHVVGPRYAIDSEPAELLVKTMRNVLDLADAKRVRRVAVPAISTGSYGYPIAEAGPLLVDTARAMAASLKHVREIRFVLCSADAIGFFRNGPL
jgi:O-acetyl-ADP-ribose deacetylase (regulator of RNase III)